MNGRVGAAGEDRLVALANHLLSHTKHSRSFFQSNQWEECIGRKDRLHGKPAQTYMENGVCFPQQKHICCDRNEKKGYSFCEESDIIDIEETERQTCSAAYGTDTCCVKAMNAEATAHGRALQ